MLGLPFWDCHLHLIGFFISFFERLNALSHEWDTAGIYIYIIIYIHIMLMLPCLNAQSHLTLQRGHSFTHAMQNLSKWIPGEENWKRLGTSWYPIWSILKPSYWTRHECSTSLFWLIWLLILLFDCHSGWRRRTRRMPRIRMMKRRLSMTQWLSTSLNSS